MHCMYFRIENQSRGDNTPLFDFVHCFMRVLLLWQVGVAMLQGD